MKLNIDVFYRIFYCFTVFFAFLSNTAHAELTGSITDGADSRLAVYDSVEVSLLTCTPHEEIYSLYGHTAIRINDKAHNEDIAVNYGVFDSSAPNFVPHFVMGQTDYKMEMFPMIYFFREYSYYGCAVREQVLNLTRREKMMLVNALFENNRPENKCYRYNFFYNNCTTKARDIILSNIEGKVEYKTTSMQEGERSFRELIHWKNEEYPWAAIGNDLLLGVNADKNTNREERQFLPEILMEDFDKADIVGQNGSRRKLVKKSEWILQPGTSRLEPMASFPLRPVVCTFIIFILVSGVTFYEIFKRKKPLAWFDWVMFTLFALPGFVLTAMLFSEHPTVTLNYQLLIFNPLWLLYLPLRKRFGWINYIALMAIFAFFVLSFVQDYAEGMELLALCLLLRVKIRYEK